MIGRIYILLLACLLFMVKPDSALAQEKDSGKVKQEKIASDTTKNDASFGDFVKQAGLGIWNRIKDRLNLEEATESLRERSKNLLGSEKTSPSDSTQNQNRKVLPADKPRELKEQKDGN